MTILFGVIGAFAILSGLVAVMQAMRIVQLAPKGERMASYFALGWWKFGQIQAKAGPVSASHVQIYQRAVIAFLAFVILGLLLSGWMINAGKSSADAATTSQLHTDPRIMPTDFAVNPELSRVATMPGTPVVES
jgi:hypothetical protein